MSDRIKNAIKSRANTCLRRLGKDVVSLLPKTFAMAGGCTSHWKFNDVDLFAPEKFLPWRGPGVVLSETRNAQTINLSTGPLMQLCNYWKPTLKELVESFDFGMIQTGVLVVDGDVSDVYWTNDFIEDRALSSATFTGTEYPLSSLMRCRKYAERGFMAPGIYARNMIDIMNAVLQRGFYGYDDFKDQLDAIDLRLLPEDIDEIQFGPLKDLFDKLDKGVAAKPLSASPAT